MPKIKNHKQKGMTPHEQWSKLPWKPLSINNQSFGKDSNDFMGLEVLSSDSYKLIKNQSGYTLNALKEGTILEEDEWDGEEFQDGDEWMEDENHIPKRTNKNIKSVIESYEEDNEDINDNEKKKKKRKVLDSKEDDNNDEVKKKRKGLEEVMEVNVEGEGDKISKKDKKKDKKNKIIDDNDNTLTITKTKKTEKSSIPSISQNDEGDCEWGPIILQKLLYQALIDLGFSTPTPIQAETIPITINKLIDIVGAAETGSGKTLAFGLPIIDYLIRNYGDIRSNPSSCPTSIIIAPTRELALQITSVLKSVCEKFKSKLRIEIVAVVGGMAEQKQRRQLCGNRPVDILVATPGRLSELMEDNEIIAFQNLAYVRYLVVDEADRIMEEGHFSELLRVFSRIKDHEKLMERGEDPIEVARKQHEGTYEADYDNDVRLDDNCVDNDDNDIDLDDILPKFEPMPTEEQIAEARRKQPKIPYNESKEEERVRKEQMNEEALRLLQFGSNGDNDDRKVYLPRQRQTLLFSATAIQSQIDNDKHKKKKKIKGIGSGAVKNLPYHLQQLLGLVAIRGNTEIIDVTGVSKAIAKKKDNKSDQSNTNKNNNNINNEDNNEGTFAALPKTLTQFEIRAPTEEKDVMVYYFLLKNVGRTLLFVNSIKTARRVDGLLRALGLNCRTIHAQLQQRQRLRALEGFRSSPIGVLVATDVAARGLDIPKIQYVIHYDIARSPQVYIHRSGRTARANSTGTTVSVVSPEDRPYHDNIYAALGVKSLPNVKIDIQILPLLRERVSIAKKIFTQSFVISQKSKEKNWLQQSATDADLDFDDYMNSEIDNNKDDNNNNDAEKKKSLEKLKSKLNYLLNTPLEKANQGTSSRKRGFIVVAK